MKTVIYLTPAELKLFNKLPASLRSEWQSKIAEEKGTAFETPKQLQIRLSISRLNESPAARKFRHTLAKKVASGNASAIDFGDFPDDGFENFIQAIGACGVCALIEMSFMSGKMTNDYMKGVADLSAKRHNMLRKNLLLA